MTYRKSGTALVLLSVLLLLMTLCTALGEGNPALTLDQTELTLEKGKGQKITSSLENVENPKKAKTTWESSDPKVATVDPKGSVRARDGGSTVITCTATLEDGNVLTASVSVTVTVPVQALRIQTRANTVLPFGESLQLEYTLQPGNATDKTVIWQSDHEDVLRVDESGRVTALSAGRAKITGKTANGKTAGITLYVPTLSPSGDTFVVTPWDRIYPFTYCGDDFDANVRITTGGKAFDFMLIRDGTQMGLLLIPLSPGKGSLTLADRRDAGAKFTVSVQIPEEAFPEESCLLIREAAYDPGEGILTVTWLNTGRAASLGADLRIVPLDAEGNDLLIGDGYVEEILGEEREYHTAVPCPPGGTATASFRIGGAYPEAVSAAIAFDRVLTAREGEERAETVEREFPDDRLLWYSTSEKAYLSIPESTDPYTPPDQGTFDLAKRMRLGITTCPVTGELASAYGFAFGGLLILSVEKDSPSDTMGLKSGDLIFCANDLYCEEDPYFLVRALSGLASGLPATLLMERDNEFYELTLSADMP